MEPIPPTQIINGPVFGGMAGRDLHHHSTILQFPERKPESQLQAEFAQRTGIWCPKPARLWFEGLLESGHFTARELNVAWKTGSLGWDPKRDESRISTPLLEAVAGYGLSAFVLFFFATEALLIILSGKTANTAVVLGLLGSGGISLGVCWVLHRFLLWPRWIAMRARESVNHFE